MTSTLIRGADVLSVDPEVGTVPSADILIEGNTITDIGPNLSAPGAEVIDARSMIAMPGLVDTHRHVWAGMLRGCACNGNLGDYFGDVVFTYGAAFTPQDTYTSARLALAETLANGITTIHAWEHNIQTPEHADAGVQALRDMGIRGRFSYGSSSDTADPTSFVQGSEPLRFDDILRLRKQQFTGDGLLHIGVASRGVEFAREEVWQREFAWARENGLPLTAHSMMTPHDLESGRSVSIYHQQGVLGPDLLLVHALRMNDDEIGYLADTGTPVSLSIMSELRTGMGLPPTLAMMRAGVPVCLSLDTMAASDNADMFQAMRVTMGIERARYDDGRVYRTGDVLHQATLAGARALGLGQITGSLRPGARADLILIRADDLNIAPVNNIEGNIVLAAAPSNVDTVFVDGVCRKRDGELLGVNVPALVAEARAAVTDLSRRLGKPVA